MSLSKQEFTDAGRSMLGRAQAGEILTVTKLVVGSGSANQASDLWPLTQPIVQEHLFNVSAKRDYGNGILLVEGSFKSAQVARAFLMRELGVMAHIGNEADRLYSVSNVFLEQPDNVDPVSPSVHSFKVKLVIDRIPEDKLTIQIGPTENVMGENLGADTVGPGVYKEAAGNVLRFRRIIEGSGMEIRYEPTPDGDAIYIGVSTLKQDLDLYVPLDYPNAPSQDVCFPSVQAAHDHLLQWLIPTDKFARIHVGPNILHHTGTNFSHPNSRQISLLGWPRVDVPIVVINYVNPQRKNVQVASTAGLTLEVGRPVYVAWSQSGHVGGSQIVSVAGNVITLSTVKRGDTRPPYTTQSTQAQCPSQRMSYYPSVLWLDDPNPSQRATVANLQFPYGINKIENICAVGGFVGFAHYGIAWMKDCQAQGIQHGVHGITGIGSSLYLQGEIVSSDQEWGIDGAGNVFSGPNDTIMVNGNVVGLTGSGVGHNFGAINPAYVNAWVYINHCGAGVRNWAGMLHVGHVIYQNNDIGFDIGNNGVLLVGPLGSVPLNNGLDLRAQGLSYINYTREGGPMPTCSPAVGVAGNSNSWIDVSA